MTDHPAHPSGMPVVSVLVPAFNHERFVERCLDSIVEEPYPAKEIVIVDDGSTDGTGDRIAAWASRHGAGVPIRFHRRSNRGVVATLNEMAGLAQGEFLRLGASDDYLLPGGLHAQVGYLLAHPGKGAVIGDSIVVDGEGQLMCLSGMEELHGVDKRLYRNDDGIRRAVIDRWAVSGSVTMLRRSTLENIGGWTEGLQVEDWDMFLRLVARDALGFIDIPVCAYRLHGANASRMRQVERRVTLLEESYRVAVRRMGLFADPERTLLRAQIHYIAAKLAYLRCRPLKLAVQLVLSLALKAVAACRHRPGAASLARHA